MLVSPAAAQAPAEPVLTGEVLLGDSVLREGTVVLHRVSTESQGEVDSTRVSREGTFAFRLPTMPDAEASEVYFVSVRHAGVLYFGKAVTLPVQLDSVYLIQAYDVRVAPEDGTALAVQARNVFLEEIAGGRWQVTDLFEIRNDGTSTVVAGEGGVVWRHPLAEGATDATAGEAEMAGGGGEVVGNDLLVRSPVPPGTRLFVVRYFVPDPFLTLPLPYPTEMLEVMIREPAPLLEVPGLEGAPPVAFDEGETFRRLLGENVGNGVLRFTEARGPRRPPVQWMTVLLTLALAGIGVWAAGRGPLSPTGPKAAPAPVGRQGVILEIARLDEEFSARPSPTAEERGAYEARRGALLRRLSHLD